MLYVDLPTTETIKQLVNARSDAAASIYLPTHADTAQVHASRILFGNLARDVLSAFEANGLDKRRLSALEEQLAVVEADEEFWQFQATGLAVLATPDSVRTFRLPTHLTEATEVSDRFFIKPLLRALASPQAALVLALTEQDPRLVQVSPDQPAQLLHVEGMPKDAASALSRPSVNMSSARGRLQGGEGQKVLLAQYARKVDAAIRATVDRANEPLILAASEPLLSIYRGVASSGRLVDHAIDKNPSTLTPSQLADEARQVLDALHATRIADVRERFAERVNSDRATTDVGRAARAATFGAIDTLLVDIDHTLPGHLSDDDGKVSYADGASAASYDIIDEIAGRALLSGATVIGARREDIPDGALLAAILRFAL